MEPSAIRSGNPPNRSPIFDSESLVKPKRRPRIVATELRRDVSQELDDHFEIVIDSNHDRRYAYVFRGESAGHPK
jgi:hypothetical protein